MTAGVLSYQLCDRQFDCERCPIDQAMRVHDRCAIDDLDRRAEAQPTTATIDEGLRDDRLYSRNHCWVMRRESVPGTGILARVGLEPGLAAALLAPRAVVQRELGAAVERGNSHLWIVTEGGTFGVAAPMSGVLQTTNEAVHDHPHLLGARPQDEGWLYALYVSADSNEFETLMCADAARSAYEVDSLRLREELRKATHTKQGSADLATKSASALRTIADALGAQRYFAILRQVYG
jgi:glycine cleavage system H lipoate-binding protein